MKNFSLDFIIASVRAVACVSFICALLQVWLLLLKHKIGKKAARFIPGPPIEHVRGGKKVCGWGADGKRNRIDFTLTLAQQTGPVNGGGTWQLATKRRRKNHQRWSNGSLRCWWTRGSLDLTYSTNMQRFSQRSITHQSCPVGGETWVCVCVVGAFSA